MTPEEYKRKALEQLAVAKDPYDRGVEAPMDELSGLDVLREPKAAAMGAVGPGAVQSLIDLLVPTELGLPALKGIGKAGKAMKSIVKPKTKMKDLPTGGIGTWNKDTAIPEVGFVPEWKKKAMKQAAEREAKKAKDSPEDLLKSIYGE